MNMNIGDVSFGCPETYKEYPAENFSCQQKIFNSLLNQTLENPVGVIYVYSDLRFNLFSPLHEVSLLLLLIRISPLLI